MAVAALVTFFPIVVAAELLESVNAVQGYRKSNRRDITDCLYGLSENIRLFPKSSLVRYCDHLRFSVAPIQQPRFDCRDDYMQVIEPSG